MYLEVRYFTLIFSHHLFCNSSPCLVQVYFSRVIYLFIVFFVLPPQPTLPCGCVSTYFIGISCNINMEKIIVSSTPSPATNFSYASFISCVIWPLVSRFQYRSCLLVKTRRVSSRYSFINYFVCLSSHFILVSYDFTSLATPLVLSQVYIENPS